MRRIIKDYGALHPRWPELAGHRGLWEVGRLVEGGFYAVYGVSMFSDVLNPLLFLSIQKDLPVGFLYIYYNSDSSSMAYDWDEEKNRTNKAKHGIGFEAMERFEWDTAAIEIDDEDYGELREFADGFIGSTLHRVVFTQRNGVVRVISLRRATRREKLRYGKRL